MIITKEMKHEMILLSIYNHLNNEGLLEYNEIIQTYHLSQKDINSIFKTIDLFIKQQCSNKTLYFDKQSRTYSILKTISD